MPPTASIPTNPLPTALLTEALVPERSRRPRQVRGERRVEVILDAAAALIAEGGAEGLTIQALSERARTSKGSLYHFFPDMCAVLGALADRHREAITVLTMEIVADETIDWSALPLEQVIDRFLAPISYLDAHPDLLALARTTLVADRTIRRLAPIRDLAEHVLSRRCDALSAQQRLAASSTMVALVDGIVAYGLRSEDVTPQQMAVELRRALCAYLGALDDSVAASAVSRSAGHEAVHSEEMAHAEFH